MFIFISMGTFLFSISKMLAFITDIMNCSTRVMGNLCISAKCIFFSEFCEIFYFWQELLFYYSCFKIILILLFLFPLKNVSKQITLNLKTTFSIQNHSICWLNYRERLIKREFLFAEFSLSSLIRY